MNALHQTDVVRFDYTFNRPGSIVMLVGSGLLLAGALGLYLWTKFEQFGWFLLAAFMILGAIGTWFYVYKWYKFAHESFLALTAEHLYVGDITQAWRAHWTLLDVQTLGFDRLNPSRYSSTLNIQLAGQNISMFLYNPLVHLGDLQGFMIQVLHQLQSEDAQLALDGDDAHNAQPDHDEKETSST